MKKLVTTPWNAAAKYLSLIPSPAVAVAALAHVDLGLMGLLLFGSERLHKAYGRSAAQGKTVMCLGNTENLAGSDVAGISMTAGC